MNFNQIISTIAGGFLFPFMIGLIWGKLVEAFGPAGGWVAGGMIVGTAWVINHGMGMIYQSGAAWLDMGWAAGVGLMAVDVFAGKKINWSMVLSGIVGGLVGGFILSTWL